MPLESKGPYEVKLSRGVPLEIRPFIDGKAISLDGVFLLWSDGRSWRKGVAPEKTASGSLRIPAMRPGKNSMLAVKLDGDRATHFSRIIEFELAAGEPKKIDVPLRPSLRIQGVLSANVPRPVRQGRIKTETLPPAGYAANRVNWFSWTAIRPDGTFTIDGWPADEPMQLIALCDEYIATSGAAPSVVQHPRDPKVDPFKRPQVFDPGQTGLITVAMSPLVRCVATAVDGDDKPVAGVNVVSCPNVGWWNWGSQIYCHPLVRCERLLRERDYESAIDEAFPVPFRGTTDAQGKATLFLPAGKEDLGAGNNVYELPVFLGSRDVRVKLVPGETTEATLRLQPSGTEKLGEWDKLAGVVFGCSTREGRRICALPGVQKKMNEFVERFRQAKNQRDPQLLADAYNLVADAFTGVGDLAEAGKWRKKAADQAAKAKAPKASDPSGKTSKIKPPDNAAADTEKRGTEPSVTARPRPAGYFPLIALKYERLDWPDIRRHYGIDADQEKKLRELCATFEPLLAEIAKANKERQKLPPREQRISPDERDKTKRASEATGKAIEKILAAKQRSEVELDDLCDLAISICTNLNDEGKRYGLDLTRQQRLELDRLAIDLGNATKQREHEENQRMLVDALTAEQRERLMARFADAELAAAHVYFPPADLVRFWNPPIVTPSPLSFMFREAGYS